MLVVPEIPWFGNTGLEGLQGALFWSEISILLGFQSWEVKVLTQASLRTFRGLSLAPRNRSLGRKMCTLRVIIKQSYNLKKKRWSEWRSLSCVWLFVIPWPIQSMEFSSPEYWSGKPFPSPGDLPNTGIEPRCPALQADSLPAEPQGKPRTCLFTIPPLHHYLHTFLNGSFFKKQNTTNIFRGFFF